jgi:hypothetical protein
VTHTLVRGGLTLRSGFDIRRHENTFRFGFLEPPFYSLGGYVGFDGLIGAFPGQPQVMSGFASATQFGSDDSGLRTKVSLVQEYFTQADVRVARRITLNLGLRYSYFGVYRETSDRESNLYAVDTGGRTVVDASPFEFGRAQNQLLTTGDDRPLYQPDRNNFQPRLGLAWTFGDSGRTVVRASYGLFNDRIFSGQFDNNTSNPPYATSGAAFVVPVLLATPLPIIPDTPSIYAIDPSVRNPSTHQFNATIERAIGSHMSATASYVGTRAGGLLRGLEPNGSGAVPQALRPDPRFVDQRFITNYSSADYDALQLALRHRLSAGVDFTAAYTLGRSQDDTSADTPLSFDRIPSLLNRGASAAEGFQGGGALFVERPRSADVADSAFDIRHALTISHIVDLPFGPGRRFFSGDGVAARLLGGFSVAGILRFHTGTPVNVTLGRDVNDDGDTSQDRPALLSGSLQELYARDGTQYLVIQEQARRLVGVPADVTDPDAAIPRNALRGPDVLFYDMSVTRRLAIGRSTMSLELNVFNLFNRTNFGQPVSDLSSPFFGQVTSTRRGTNPRQLQLGLKFSF